MATNSIIDIDSIVQDLRIATVYASRVGLLREKDVLEVVKSADQVINRSDHQPDVSTLMHALNEVTRVIAPMTLADLKFGRDPFSEENQRKSRAIQLSLTLFSLVVLVVIGFSMDALRKEQSSLQALHEVQELRPQLRLTALRKMAQYDAPVSKQNALYDDFHQRIGELRAINGKLVTAYVDGVVASQIPLFPWGQYFESSLSSDHDTSVASGPLPPSKAESKSPKPSGSVLINESMSHSVRADNSANTTTGDSGTVGGKPASLVTPSPDKVIFCAAELNGNIRLPAESSQLPAWMKRVLADALGDFCFQLKVLWPDGDGQLLNEALGKLTFVSRIKEKVSLRVAWFLPFLYGLLGSAIFLMRNVASIRTPAMQWFPIVMRLSLGGVAGIVMGWFSSTAALGQESTSAFSIPFALAFLTGYGIDALFNLLDGLNRKIVDTPTLKSA